MKVYKTIEHMTYSVDAIEGVRNGANERAAKLPEKSPLRAQLQQLAAKCEELRSKIVATKEGGAITGEERIREHLGQVYGAVNNYEGRPTEYQAARADSLARELEDVISDFQKLTQKELPAINAGLKKSEAISVLTEADWQKKREGEGRPGSASGMRLAGGGMWERD
jgi:predicted metalloendopeptidase